MQDYLLNNELTVRTTAFLGLFCAVVLAERYAPRRVLTYRRTQRWFSNIGLLLFGTLLLRLLPALSAMAVADAVSSRGWGLLPLLSPPPALALCLGVILLDLAIYLQHVASHHVPLLWRVHRVHHADPDFDVTTALRFHPIEIVLSMAFKCIVVTLLGPPLLAVLLFEVLLNGCAMFNHGNFRLPPRFDHILRYLLVTPDMHRVHHSIHGAETNSNFGFSLALWDRLFRTYTAAPRDGQRDMVIGMPWRGGHYTCRELLPMLTLPMRRALKPTTKSEP